MNQEALDVLHEMGLVTKTTYTNQDKVFCTEYIIPSNRPLTEAQMTTLEQIFVPKMVNKYQNHQNWINQKSSGPTTNQTGLVFN